MGINIDTAIKWFESKIGKVTYSMSGSRNGSDGTGDCSGMVVTALWNGGASKPAWLYNTDSMHDWLKSNGFELISFNKSWGMQKGDVIITGIKGQSTGAAGHTAIAVDSKNIIDCAWYGSTTVNAVRIHSESDMPYSAGFYVYRLKKSNATNTPPTNTAPAPSTNIKWYDEKGTFTVTVADNLNIREKPVNGKVIGTLKQGQSAKYDKFAHDGGYVWIRQPREGGKFGYIATGNSANGKRTSSWGTFK